MYYENYVDLIFIFGYSINFFITLALAALIYCLIKVERKRLSLFCYVLKIEIFLNIWFSTILFIFQPIFLFPNLSGFSMNPICSFIPYCSRINLSVFLFLLMHFSIFFIFASMFQLSRVRLTMNELLDYHKFYVCNQHRRFCIFVIIGIIEFILLLCFVCLITFGSQSRFETSTLLNANGLASFIPYQPYSFNSSIPVFVTLSFFAMFLIFSIFGIFSLILRVSTTLTEFRVVGSPSLYYQNKLLRIIYNQLILANLFLFIPIIFSIIFILIKWKFSSLISSIFFLLISFYPVLSNIAIIIFTPHFWEKIHLTFKPFLCICLFCSSSPSSSSIVDSTTIANNNNGSATSFGFFGGIYHRQHRQSRELYRY